MRIKKILPIVGVSVLALTGCSNAASTNTGADINVSAEAGDSTSSAETTDDAATDSTAGTAAEGEAAEAVTVDTSNINLNLTGSYSDKAIAAEWDLNSSTQIALSDSGVTITGNGAVCENAIISITEPGTYVLSGSMDEIQVQVNLAVDENVQIVLNGVEMGSSISAPITALSVKNLYMTIADGTTNVIRDNREAAAETETTTDIMTDAATDTTADTTTETAAEIPTAAIYSKDDLIINGSGTLKVYGNYKDGIAGKDDLEIIDGNIYIESTDDGIVGKDSVSIRTGTIEIHAGGDGIKSSNADDATKGYVVMDGGDITIYAGDDGIDAMYALVINAGNLTIAESTEGLECLNIVINDGNVDITSTDDGINISDGSSSTSTMDPSAFADKMNRVNGTTGTMPAIPAEGSDAAASGTQTVPADGAEMPEIPATDGTEMPKAPVTDGTEMPEIPATDGTGTSASPATDSTTAVRPNRGDGTTGGKGMDGTGGGKGGMSNMVIDGMLIINGGTIHVDADGDGLDSNGNIQITGGYTVVEGPADSGNASLDYNGTCEMTGGVLILTGTAGMAQTPSSTSTQKTVSANLSTMLQAGTKISLSDASGNVLYEYTAEKSFSYVAVNAAEITSGSTYTITAGSESVEVTVQ